jgi:hypothetical protein
MKKSLSVLCAALASLPLVAVMGTSSQAANPNCGQYPPGRNFGMRVSPDPRTAGGAPIAVVKPLNTYITLSSRLFRNGQPCPHTPVQFYFHGPTDFQVISGKRVPVYHAHPAVYTDSQGLATTSVKVINDFRWFADYNEDPTANKAIFSTQGARTDGLSLVQYKR